MSHFSQGFLSSEIAEVRPAVLAMYAKWQALLLRVNAKGVEAQHAANVNRDDPGALLAAAHFARLLASVQGAVVLLEYGLISQAKTLLRMALESLFALEALRLKPELAHQLAQTHEIDKRLVADRMLRWEAPELRAAVAAKVSEGELKNYLSSKAKGLNTYELARSAEMLDWYLSLYSLLSFPAHAAVSDLTAHLEVNEAGEVVALKNEPEVAGQEPAWAYAIEIEIKAIESFSRIFLIPDMSMEVSRSELSELAAQIQS